VLARLALNGELLGGGLKAPTSSAMNGGAGFAYALLRIAAVRQDEELFGLADLWSERAAHDCVRGNEDAFWNAELEIIPETFGRNSFFHAAPGVHAVQALLARARGDEWSQQLALESFIAAAGEPCEHLDVTFGHAGLLLGCAFMLDALPQAIDAAPLKALGRTLRDRLWAQLAPQAPLAQKPQLRMLGAAHGWAGYLFALLRWSEASRGKPPAGLEQRLGQLGALGQPAGRGLRWPHETGAPAPESPLGASWCNGAAGYVALWTLAQRQLGGETYGNWARMAAWTAYEGTHATVGDLCCGFAGRAYALLNFYRHTAETAWLARARLLAEHAAQRVRQKTLRRHSLYKGDVGVALLAADLEAPEHACMPFYDTGTVAPALTPHHQ
jgi:eukaryotic-like serine/threonine-protein kinase